VWVKRSKVPSGCSIRSISTQARPRRHRLTAVPAKAVGQAGGVGERHRRLSEAEAPARAKGHMAGETRKTGDDIGKAATHDQPVIEIAIRRLVAAIGTVIVAVLGVEIEGAGGQVIVKDAIEPAGGAVAYDQEGPSACTAGRRCADRSRAHQS